MPKNISRKDTKNIYCAFRIGEINKISQYSEIITIPCQITVFNGNRQIEYEGKTIQYSATAIFNKSKITNYINSNCKVWYKSKPIDTTKSDAEYLVVAKNNDLDGLFVVYLVENSPNYNKLYVEKDNIIYSISVDYNKDTLKGVIPTDMYFPFNEYNKYWDRKPANVADVNNRLSLISITKEKEIIELQFARYNQ